MTIQSVTNIKCISVLMLVGVFGMALFQSTRDTERELAERILESGDVTRLELSDESGLATFQSGSRTALFFSSQGMQGPIRGVLVVENDQVIQLLIIESREGIDQVALESSSFCDAFRFRSANPPLVVDAVSGATISSNVVMDAVNARLTQWIQFNNQADDDRPSH